MKRRMPEPEEEMADELEVLNFFLAHKKLKKIGWDLYDLVSRNILKYISIQKGIVLDVGCGYGGLMNSLLGHRKNLNFIGVDTSNSMIKVGKKYIANKKIKFLLKSAYNTGFERDLFDLILCKDTIHHFNNPSKAISEMYRVLKPGGQIYITDLRRDAPKEVIYQVIQMASELNEENAELYIDSIQASYTYSEIQAILKQTGIKNYKLFYPKITKSFLKEYKVNPNFYLPASNYFRDKWILIIKKPLKSSK